MALEKYNYNADGNYERYTSVSAVDCTAYCFQLQSCTYAAYGDNGVCLLFTSGVELRPEDGFTMYKKMCSRGNRVCPMLFVLFLNGSTHSHTTLKPRSDTAEYEVLSESTLFALNTGIFKK